VSEALISTVLTYLGQLVLFAVYHYGIVRPGQKAAAPAPLSPAPLPPASAPPGAGPFLGNHPLFARLASRFDDLVQQAAAQAAAGIIPAILAAPVSTVPPPRA
jgi:hypothetical protein